MGRYDELRAQLQGSTPLPKANSGGVKKKPKTTVGVIKGAYDEIRNNLLDIDPEFSSKGVPDFGFRAGLSAMDTDPERENYLNRITGQGGWTKDRFNQYALTPQGMTTLNQPPIATIIDEPGLSRYDVADVAGDLPGIAGATGAGLMASGLGWAPGMAIAGLGAAGGKALGELYEEYKGLNLQGPAEVATDLAKEGGLAATGEGIFRGFLAPIGRKLLAPEAKRVTPETKRLVGEALEIGARPNVSQVTKAPILSRTQSMLHKIFNDPAANQNSIALKKEMVRLAHASGPKVTSQKTGEQVAGDISRARGALSRWANRNYGIIDEAVGGQPVVPVQRLKNEASQILDLLPLDKNTGEPIFASKDTIAFLKQVAGLDDLVTFSQAQMIRGQLYNAIADDTLIPGVSSHHASVLYKAAKGGLDDAVTAGHLPPDIAGTLKVVNSRYKKEITKYNDAFLQRIMADPSKAGMIEPTQIVNMAFRKGGSTKLERLFRVIKPGTQAKVRRVAMEDVLSNVLERSDDPLVSVFNGKKLLSTLDGYGEDTLKSMFGEDLTKKLYRFGNVTQLVTQKMAMSGGLVAAHVALHPWQNLGKLVRFNMFSKFLNSDVGLKWLTEGFEAKTTRDVTALATRAMDQMLLLADGDVQSDAN